MDTIHNQEKELKKILTLQCLNLLQMHALRGQTTHYDTMEVMLGINQDRTQYPTVISGVLRSVHDFCKLSGLPPLDVLVVRRNGKDKGLPGPGFWIGLIGEVPPIEVRKEKTQLHTNECFNLFATLGI